VLLVKDAKRSENWLTVGGTDIQLSDKNNSENFEKFWAQGSKKILTKEISKIAVQRKLEMVY
jgi:hypothetical protein